MTTWREAFPRPVAVLCLVVLLVQGALVVALLRSSTTGTPHDVPVAVVAPAVVAGPYGDRLHQLAGDSFEAVPVDDAAEAQQALRDGTVDAVLEVDLTITQDTVTLHEAQDARLNEAVLIRIRAVESTFDRSLEVGYVDSDGDPVDGQGPGAGNAYDLTLAANLAGFFLVLVVSLVAGPVARNLRLGVARVLLLGLVAVAVGAGLAAVPATAVEVHPAAVTGLAALGVAVAAVITLATEAVAGLAGLAITATAFLVAATPLITRTNVHLLAQPWRATLPWTPPGAMLDEVSRLVASGPSGERRSLLVLLAWLAVAVVTLLVARRVRGRYGIAPDAPALTERSPGARRSTSAVVLWRVRVATVAVPVGVLLLGAVALLPQPDLEPASSIEGASQTRCAAVREPSTVRDLNRFAGGSRRTPAFDGGDVGAEVRLQDGRRLWLFGDTLRDPGFPGPDLVRNSMLVTDSECLRVVLPADDGAIIPDRRDGVGYWPMSIVQVARPGYDLVTVSTQRVRTTGPGQWDFEILGPSLALFLVPLGDTPQLVAQQDVGSDAVDRSRPVWGSAAAVDGGWVYLYGTANPGDPYVFGFSLRVARAPVDEVLDVTTWRYWDGDAWVADPEAAVELVPAAGGVSQTLSVFERGGTWYALSKRDDFLGSAVVAWTAPAPTGPFSGGETLAELPSDLVAGRLTYMPLAHPDLLPRPGTVVVSYSRNSTELSRVLADPLLYRIRFLRVQLP